MEEKREGKVHGVDSLIVELKTKRTRTYGLGGLRRKVIDNDSYSDGCQV
jgi:hypothetical protein